MNIHRYTFISPPEIRVFALTRVAPSEKYKIIRSSREAICLTSCGFPHHLRHTLHYLFIFERDLWRSMSLISQSLTSSLRKSIPLPPYPRVVPTRYFLTA